ncbi:uncharacterized protein LOC144585152 isoform X2 [Pogona vitticeps]
MGTLGSSSCSSLRGGSDGLHAGQNQTHLDAAAPRRRRVKRAGDVKITSFSGAPIPPLSFPSLYISMELCQSPGRSRWIARRRHKKSRRVQIQVRKQPQEEDESREPAMSRSLPFLGPPFPLFLFLLYIYQW